jgi:hypothetical protein
LQQAIARKAALDLNPAWTAAELASRVRSLLLMLAAEFGIRGIVPGHIKALVSQEGQYAAFSCTRPGQINQKTSPDWEQLQFSNPVFSLNVVLVNEMKAGTAADRVDECLEKAFGSTFICDGCHHEHEHGHEHEDEHEHEDS